MTGTNMKPAAADAAKITTPSEREIRIERIFNAPRGTVWRAFTDPTLVAQWWGRGNKCGTLKLCAGPLGCRLIADPIFPCSRPSGCVEESWDRVRTEVRGGSISGSRLPRANRDSRSGT